MTTGMSRSPSRNSVTFRPANAACETWPIWLLPMPRSWRGLIDYQFLDWASDAEIVMHLVTSDGTQDSGCLSESCARTSRLSPLTRT